MYEVTKVTEKAQYKEEKIEVSKRKIALKYFIRTVSFILAYFLLSRDYSLFNSIVCICLISTGVIDLVLE